MCRVLLKPWRFLPQPNAAPPLQVLFNKKVNFVAGVEFRVVIRHHNTNFQSMLARLDAGEGPLCRLKHSRHLAIDIGVHMLAALAFDQLEMKWNLVTGENLIVCRCENFDFRTLGGRQNCGPSFRLAFVIVRTIAGGMIPWMVSTTSAKESQSREADPNECNEL